MRSDIQVAVIDKYLAQRICELSSAGCLVLFGLISYALESKQKHFYYSIAKLVSKTGLSSPTIQKARMELIKKGFVFCRTNYFKKQGNFQALSSYDLSVPLS